MTTKAIKEGQYKPAKVTKVASNRWHVESKSSDKRTITRYKNKWTCDCPAKSPTCRHVTSVLMDELKAQGGVGAVWTSEQEAKRQRRKIWELTRHGRQFWMPGRPAPRVPRPPKRGKFIRLTTDIFGVQDAHWVVGGYPGRY